MRGIIGLRISLVAVACWTTAASGQTVTVVHTVNLRPDPSTEYPAMRLLTPSEPPLTLLEATPESEYYHVRTAAGEDGYVWGGAVRVSVTPLAGPLPSGPGVPGSASMVGCGDSLWQHVYHPSRLLVQQDCVTVTGVLVDATAGEPHHQPDGVRHEPDGDTHGWLRVDSQFASLINPGNRSDEGGNLVFEIVCHYTVTQSDAQPACAGFTTTRSFRPSARTSRSREPSCGKRTTSSGTRFTPCHASRRNSSLTTGPSSCPARVPRFALPAPARARAAR